MRMLEVAADVMSMSACRLLLVVLLCGVRVGQWSENAKLFCIVDLLPFAAGLCVDTADTVPESGSVIGKLEGTQNVSLYCAITRNGSISIATLWLKEILEDREAGRGGRVISPDDDNFILSGEAINLAGGISVPSNTNLTIVSLTGDLQHVIIFCVSGQETLANFTLEVYGKRLMSMYINNMACGPAHGVTIVMHGDSS